MQIDVTITACRRTLLLRETLESFTENLLKFADCRAIINVDPVGPDTQEATTKVASEFFDVHSQSAQWTSTFFNLGDFMPKS